MVLLRAPFLSFIITTLLVSLFYGPELSHPNKYFFGSQEDGIKNYYTIAYHQEYDTSFNHFGGMSYPYGEHIVFTDGQPILSAILWLFPSLSGYTVGIINLLMLLGIGISAWILCKLFIRMHLTRGASLFAASAIAMMSPQLLRFIGHYALAYSFLIPWIIYTAYIFMQRPSWKRSFWAFLAMAFAIGLHLYYFLIGGAFVLCFYLIENLRQRKINFLKLGLHTSVQVLLPFILYMLWLKVTDHVADRPDAPYGMLEYMANWEGVFFPAYLFADSAFFKFLGVRPISFEAMAYAGIPAGIFFVYFLLSRVKLFKKENRTFDVGNSVLLAGFLVFLFAATFPFATQITWVNEHVGPLKQFRSLGRLSWVFFYALNIFLFYRLASKRRNVGMVLSAIAIVILFFEGLLFNNTLSQQVGHERKDILAGKEVFQKDEVILPLPFFHIGSENLGTPIPKNYMAEATMELSLNSGHPTFATVLSRVSISQSIEQLEMAMNMSGPLTQNTAPCLIFRDAYFKNRITDLIEFLPTTSIDQYKFYHTSFKQLSELKKESRPEETPLENVLLYKDFQDLDESHSEIGLCNRKGLLFKGEKVTELGTIQASQDSVSVSFWIKANEDGFRNYRIIFENLETKEVQKTPLTHLCDNVFKSYARVIVPPQVYTESYKVSLEYAGGTPVRNTLHELLIRKGNAPFAYRSGKVLFTNEFVYALD